MTDEEPTEIRTLVVDDSDFFAEMTAETLENEHGMNAVFETSAEDALKLLTDEEFDCIVSDYQMPGINGLEFLRAVRRKFSDVPFILLTGRGDEEIASEAIAAGVADYLIKLKVVEDREYERLANRIRSVVAQRRAKKKYELLVHNSPDAIAHVAWDGELIAVNPAMEEVFERDREDLVGASITAVMDDDIARARLEKGRTAIEDGEVIGNEDSYDGRFFDNLFVPVDLWSDRDTFQMISRDITERKERERELRRQNERLEKFASVVSHDLRNPLNVARSSLEFIAEDAPDDHVERLDRSLTRMEAIIEDVLALARQGQTVHDPSVVDLERMVTEAWSYVDADGATLHNEADGRVKADPSRVQELFGNLFRNTVDHVGTDVTLTVGTTEEGFYVADDGPGIPEDERDEIFKMGFTTADAGTGLGLSIVQQIAEAHGWDLDVTDSDDGGARFEITDVERPGEP